MKQLIIGKNIAYPSGVTFEDLTQLSEGAVGVFDLGTSSLVSSKAGLVNNFAVACGRGENKMPICFPEVDVKTLRVTKASYEAGVKFTSTITVPTPEAGKEYTVIISKHGVVFNERSNWTFTALAKSTIAADVAAEIVRQINANSHNSGVTAENTAGAITVTAVKEGDNYTLTGADELIGVKPTSTTEGKVAILDKAYVQDLASRCAAGKGFNYTYADGDSIYPGYPEVVDSDKYVLYTLRFAVPRVSAKQRDEVVYQILHIAVPYGSASIATFDAVFSIDSLTGSSDFECGGDDTGGDTESGTDDNTTTD